LGPENSEGYFKRAMFFDLTGELEKSFADITTAFELSGIPQAMVHFNVGKHHLRSERYKLALEELGIQKPRPFKFIVCNIMHYARVCHLYTPHISTLDNLLLLTNSYNYK
jgi:hypothetical protein